MKMTTAKKLIKYLETIPEETEIKIVEILYSEGTMDVKLTSLDLSNTDHINLDKNVLKLGSE